MPIDRNKMIRIAGAIGIALLVLLVIYYGYNQIPAATRPRLIPSSALTTIPVQPTTQLGN